MRKKNMKKYLLLSHEHNNFNSSYNLGCYYQFIEPNEEEMIKYYIIAIEHNHERVLENIIKYYHNNILKVYLIFKKYQTKNKYIEFQLKKLEEKNSVIYFLCNKVRLLSKTQECPICLDTTICIPIACSHYFCVECYVVCMTNNKCAYCLHKLY